MVRLLLVEVLLLIKELKGVRLLAMLLVLVLVVMLALLVVQVVMLVVIELVRASEVGQVAEGGVTAGVRVSVAALACACVFRQRAEAVAERLKGVQARRVRRGSRWGGQERTRAAQRQRQRAWDGRRSRWLRVLV